MKKYGTPALSQPFLTVVRPSAGVSFISITWLWGGEWNKAGLLPFTSSILCIYGRTSPRSKSIPKKSKTKGLLARRHLRKEKSVLLNGHPIPWVENAAHLVHELHTTGSQDFDCRMRRVAHIGETTELLGIFQNAHPLQKLAAIQTYACALYGSNLWDPYGPAACQTYKCWNVSVRDAWGVTRLTRTYIGDHLLAGSLPPIRQLVLRR